MPSENYNAFDHKGWDEAGLKNYEDFSDAITYVNQRDIGDQLEGGWWYSDDETKTIYTGTFGNYNSPGASSYTNADVYDDEEEYKAEVAKLEATPEYVETEDDEDEDMDDEEETDEPEEGDYKTEDHRKFYQYGKLVLDLEEDADHVAELRKHMEQEKFWPNAWFISDHGNAHLIDMSE